MGLWLSLAVLLGVTLWLRDAVPVQLAEPVFVGVSCALWVLEEPPTDQ